MTNEQLGLGSTSNQVNHRSIIGHVCLANLQVDNAAQGILTCARCRTPKPLPAFGKRTRHRLADICRDCKAANRYRSEYYSTNLRRAFHGTLAPDETQALIGCSAEALRTHLQALFAPDMRWDNYGRKGWHIDHLAPCAAFDLADPAQRQHCYHYTNLRPAWAADNHHKSGKILPEAYPALQRAGLLLAA